VTEGALSLSLYPVTAPSMPSCSARQPARLSTSPSKRAPNLSFLNLKIQPATNR
jgi:hypothetical protein